MPFADEKEQIFAQLKTILQEYADGMACTVDDAENYSLNTKHIMKNKKPLFFGAVNIKKRYVSYHLMPVYVEPALLDNCSEPLKKRMQGKSCFNFAKSDEAQFAELAELTQLGYQHYQENGLLE